jgi:hypothetical protein
MYVVSELIGNEITGKRGERSHSLFPKRKSVFDTSTQIIFQKEKVTKNSPKIKFCHPTVLTLLFGFN